MALKMLVSMLPLLLLPLSHARNLQQSYAMKTFAKTFPKAQFPYFDCKSSAGLNLYRLEPSHNLTGNVYCFNLEKVAPKCTVEGCNALASDTHKIVMNIGYICAVQASVGKVTIGKHDGKKTDLLDLTKSQAELHYDQAKQKASLIMTGLGLTYDSFTTQEVCLTLTGVCNTPYKLCGGKSCTYTVATRVETGIPAQYCQGEKAATLW